MADFGALRVSTGYIQSLRKNQKPEKGLHMTAKERERVNGLRREIQVELEYWTMLELHYRMIGETKSATLLQQLPPEFVRAGNFLSEG